MKQETIRRITYPLLGAFLTTFLGISNIRAEEPNHVKSKKEARLEGTVWGSPFNIAINYLNVVKKGDIINFNNLFRTEEGNSVTVSYLDPDKAVMDGEKNFRRISGYSGFENDARYLIGGLKLADVLPEELDYALSNNTFNTELMPAGDYAFLVKSNNQSITYIVRVEGAREELLEDSGRRVSSETKDLEKRTEEVEPLTRTSEIQPGLTILPAEKTGTGYKTTQETQKKKNRKGLYFLGAAILGGLIYAIANSCGDDDHSGKTQGDYNDDWGNGVE